MGLLRISYLRLNVTRSDRDQFELLSYSSEACFINYVLHARRIYYRSILRAEHPDKPLAVSSHLQGSLQGIHQQSVVHIDSNQCIHRIPTTHLRVSSAVLSFCDSKSASCSPSSLYMKLTPTCTIIPSLIARLNNDPSPYLRERILSQPCRSCRLRC